MMASIRLFKGAFGHVSVLNAASDLVTHAHPEAHVVIWLDGDPGHMAVGETMVRPGPNEAVCVNSLQPHSHHFSDGKPGSFLAFYLQPEWAAIRMGRSPGTPLFRNPVVRLDNSLRTTTSVLLDQLFGGSGCDDFAAHEVERIIDRLIGGIGARQSAMPPKTAAAARLDHRIRKALALMQANVSGRVGLDEVARGVGLSRPHFFSLFKDQTGLTPNVYWNTLRMDEALRQIEASEESLTCVACNLGFTTQANFTRFFRDHAGVPPTLYREAARTAA
ncbi:MAG: AraC family transcriptional regulator [Rhizobiaceae bacterium]|nr:AraC family transcriptional regulator [Rhizobiaceae bacterium]MCV0407912.1 AraC family transcriptional regulator [Rhizobiaceae bacterium]